MKRDVRDYRGIKIGELELPSNTPEEIWQHHLAKYAIPPISEMPKDPVSHVTVRQLRLALHEKEISFNAIRFYIESLETSEKNIYETEWDYGTEFEIDHPIINNILRGIKTPNYIIQEIWDLAKEK